MIGGQHILMARAALRWSIDDLAKESGVGVRTIKRFEAVNEITSGNLSTIQKLKTALEAAGIEFLGTPTDRPGIRIGTPKAG